MSNAPVVIVDYNPQWPILYEQEKSLILGAIGHIIAAIEHVGSTAVPGLGAKPIIDIMIGLHRLDDAVECIPRLQSLGYQYVPEFEASIPERRFFRKGPDEARSHHIHMVEQVSEFWKRHLQFRDYMRAHPEEVRQYQQLKQELAARFGSDRDGYSRAKAPFIQSVLARACADRASQL
jgi:GrpB-like predicted nucleotidyltransferase (UPF0157 family)